MSMTGCRRQLAAFAKATSLHWQPGCLLAMLQGVQHACGLRCAAVILE